MATLYSPDGRKYVTKDQTEIVRLKSGHGYTEKAPRSKPAEKPAQSNNNS